MVTPPLKPDDSVQTRFGSLLLGHRTRLGITQRVLADLSTVSVRAIRDLEQGRARRPRPETVRLIADGLRLSRRARADLEAATERDGFARTRLPVCRPELALPPTELESVVGRGAEISALVDELAQGRRRLVDLVGLGGVGKTRLASEVAARLHAEAVPVLWIDADPVRAPFVRDDELAALATDCAADLLGGPGPERTPAMADFAELVGDHRTLLVLDGVREHGPHDGRVHRLLTDCAGLRILVTATSPRGLAGEWTYLVRPLALPAPDDRDPADSAAVRLFLDRAATAAGFRPGLAQLPVVARICELLDGIPLALTTASAWLAVYDPDRLLAALRDTPAGLLEHLSGGPWRADTGYRLSDCVSRLPTTDRILLSRLDHLDEFTLDDVVAAAGHGQAESGRTLRTLIELGVVRTRRVAGRSVFEVLNLVRVFLNSADELAPRRLPHLGRATVALA